GARQEALACFSETDASRGADEQRRADPRLQRADRLADRRRCHVELGRGLAEIAVLRHGEERLDAVQRALPDCEVTLHGISTLSRLIAHGKRPYIPLARRTSGA